MLSKALAAVGIRVRQVLVVGAYHIQWLSAPFVDPPMPTIKNFAANKEILL